MPRPDPQLRVLALVLLGACYVGKYADYSASADRVDEVSVEGEADVWFAVEAVHQVNFEEVEESPQYADLRDRGEGSMTLAVTRVSGDGSLQAELLYWACGLNVFELPPPRQGGIVTFTDSGSATMEHPLDFVGGSKSGLGDGGALNCSPGSEPVRVLGLRLRSTGNAVWDVTSDTRVTYGRGYPEKYWEVTGGTLELAWEPSSAEELGWVPQLDGPPDETEQRNGYEWSGSVVGLDTDLISGVEVCADYDGVCAITDASGAFSMELFTYPDAGQAIRDFVLTAEEYPPTVATWFMLGGVVTGVQLAMIDDEQRAAAHDAAGTQPDPARGDVLVRVQSTSLQPMDGVPLVRHSGAGPLVSFDEAGDAYASAVSGESGVVFIPNVPSGPFGVAARAPWTCNPGIGYVGETARTDVFVRAGAVSEAVVTCY